jgi:cytochrome c oxidase assembly protein Cox11
MPAIVKRGTLFTLGALLLALAGMATLTSFSVTLYRLFCEATGALGTPQRVATASVAPQGRAITVAFDTNTAPGLPWRFTPLQRQVTLNLGQDALVFFHAQNLSATPITGRATFNVTPEKIGAYFKKVQCFCFTQETLDGGAGADMPVEFYVDPALASDPNTADVHEITLSYTFFESRKPEATAPNLSRFAAASARAEDGATLFAERCAQCHALGQAKIGPPLAGILGRQAGSVPGYPYSTALRQAGFAWTPARLETWLAGPQAMVPGAAMPAMVPEAQARRDLVAYLANVHPGS